MTEVSIVIPVKNEAENIGGLIDGIQKACSPHVRFEIIVVDDGSDDATGDVVLGKSAEFGNVRLMRHQRSAGQSAAVHSGVQAAGGAIICTLDGDGQNPPEELPKLFLPFLAADTAPQLGLVAGQRVNRQDTFSKKLASKFANGLRSRILRDETRDTGCGLKGFRKEAFLMLPYFNHMHRYLPALFVRAGWKVAHVDVSHRQRKAGMSKYSNLQRAVVGAADLIGVWWLIRRRKTATAVEKTKA